MIRRRLLAAGLAAVLIPVTAGGELPPVRDAFARQAAPLLAELIGMGAKQADTAGLRPIPPALRDKLTKHLGETALEGVRWRVGFPPGQEFIAYAFMAGHAVAVTLGDVVIFIKPEKAEDDFVWAHELEHVRQFRQWGMQGFAERYLADWQTVEEQATQAAIAYRLKRDGYVR